MLSAIFTKMEQKPHRQSFLNVWINVCVILVCLFNGRHTSQNILHLTQVVELSETTMAKRCGTVDVTINLIQGGNEVAKGQWPFIVALYQVKHFNYICAGSLISKKHVLTGN